MGLASSEPTDKGELAVFCVVEEFLLVWQEVGLYAGNGLGCCRQVFSKARDGKDAALMNSGEDAHAMSLASLAMVLMQPRAMWSCPALRASMCSELV